MMKLQHSQKGVTMASLAFYLLLLGFVVYIALKLFPVYMDAFSIESSVKGLETDRQEFSGAMSVRSALVKRFGMNNVSSVMAEDVVVKRVNQVYEVDVDYEVRIPFFKNIDLVVSFENHAEIAIH